MSHFRVDQPLPKRSPGSGERSPERIDVLVEQIRLLWHEYPNFRLGQILVNLCDPQPNALFYVEDHTVSEKIFELRETKVWPTAQPLLYCADGSPAIAHGAYG